MSAPVRNLTDAWLPGSPYLFDEASAVALGSRIDDLESRVHSLRATGTLSEAALQEYFGRSRFELVAESNAIAVLHAWLAHVHPFLDGNGRTARAVTTLELVRGALPAIVIRRRHRERYLQVTLVERRLEVEIAGVPGGTLHVRWYGSEVDGQAFVRLSRSEPTANRWVASFEMVVAVLHRVRFLLWTGFRSVGMRGSPRQFEEGPSLFWSVPNPEARYPPWVDAVAPPDADELTLDVDRPDRWTMRRGEGVAEKPSSEAAQLIARAMVDLSVSGDNP